MLTLKHKNRDSQIKPAETQISSQVFFLILSKFRGFCFPLKKYHARPHTRGLELGFTVIKKKEVGALHA